MTKLISNCFWNEYKVNRVLLVALFIAFILGVYFTEYAKAQFVCDIDQVTDTNNGDLAARFLNSDGTLGGFSSTDNINGGNPDGSAESYIFDTDTFVITQLTDSVGFDSSIQDISDDGSLIVLTSSADLTGGNADGNREIFLFDTDTMMFTQITDTTGVETLSVSLNADGSLIAFNSGANLTGGNADGNLEIFLFDTDTMMFTMVTSTVGVANIRPSISSDGSTIVFFSDANSTLENPDGSQEVFLFDVMTSSLFQITDGNNLFSTRPSVNADGSVISFASQTNPTGENPDGNLEIFLFNNNTMIFTQVTDTTVNHSSSSITPDGTRVTFRSAADLTGDNPDTNEEVFQFDSTTGRTEQITNTLGGSIVANIPTNSNGSAILFSSTSNIGGGNPDGGLEIYFANCRVDVVSDGSGGGGCVMAGNPKTKRTAANLAVLLLPLLIIGLRTLRRKKATA